MNITLENPYALLALVLIPIYQLWYWIYYRKRRLILKLSYVPSAEATKSQIMVLLQYIPDLMLLAGIVCVIFAMAAPTIPSHLTDLKRKGIEIMLLMDTSGSMLTEDIRPNRWERMRAFAKKLVNERPGDKFGIVAFAEEALCQTPLTPDHQHILSTIDEMTIELIPNEGTAMGNAIAEGLLQSEHGICQTKVMILLTDGIHNNGLLDPISTSRLARNQQIRMFPLSFGQIHQFKTTTPNEVIHPDTAILGRIASLSGGKYFISEDSTALKALNIELDKLPRTDYAYAKYRKPDPLYHSFLLLSLVFISISLGLKYINLYNPLEL